MLAAQPNGELNHARIGDGAGDAAKRGGAKASVRLREKLAYSSH